VSSIAPDIDVYGTYARFSAVADWVERVVAGGRAISEATLADYISDNDWTFSDQWDLGDFLKVPETDDDDEGARENEVDRSRMDARKVFSLFEERATILAEKYPFDIVDRHLQLREGVDLFSDVYVAVWALTLAHAYDLVDNPKPTQVFEEMIPPCLKGPRLLVENFGALRRSKGSFSAALETVGGLIRLPVSPSGAVRSTRAQDENADLLAHFWWGDQRSGHWGFVGQATCGKSDTWDSKIMETSAPAWKGWLGTIVPPLAFLAVPHHVEPSHLIRLVSGRERLVIDRLRLVRFKTDCSEAEKEIIRKVLEAVVDEP
jgi:hypothetical protein